MAGDNDLKQKLLQPRPPAPPIGASGLGPGKGAIPPSSTITTALRPPTPPPGASIRQPTPDLATLKKGRPGLRSWISIDWRGHVKKVEADKVTIMHRCELPARDLRLLDPVFVYPSTILGREKAIVVNLERIRCIITSEECLVLDTGSLAVQQYKKELQRRIMTGDSMAHMGSSRVEPRDGAGGEHVNEGPPMGPLGSFIIEDANGQSSVWPREYPHQEDGPAVHSILSDSDMFSGGGGAGEDLPFEFRAMEIALDYACSYLDAEASKLAQYAYPLLERLAFQISTGNLELVRRLKSNLVALTRKVQKVRDEIEQLMDDDGDMAEMYLTEKKLRAELSGPGLMMSSHYNNASSGLEGDGGFGSVSGTPRNNRSTNTPRGTGTPRYYAPGGGTPSSLMTPRYGSGALSAPVSPVSSPKGNAPTIFRDASMSRHFSGSDAGDEVGGGSHVSEVENVEDLEMLLEAYFVVADGTLNKLTQMSQYIDDTEDFINIQLDSVRNQLIQFELLLTTATFVVAMFGVVAGVFGMNVPLGLEDDPSALNWILWCSGIGGATVFCLFLLYFRYRNLTIV
eukprot:TRINITY_DN474_c0_g1_i1.p1 TRINITY_DN474_c0_g1~~TRINITY_DN474_c0_g1_i1.p1  ORF type:complete len:569 (+),score=106.23 TRINITY_DN474_c0_g1_i1:631-2337(+)